MIFEAAIFHLRFVTYMICHISVWSYDIIETRLSQAGSNNGVVNMSLAHAILGMLQTRPMTGYDLKVECFDNSIAHFWQADQAQIYRTLDKLAEDGLVT